MTYIDNIHNINTLIENLMQISIWIENLKGIFMDKIFTEVKTRIRKYKRNVYRKKKEWLTTRIYTINKYTTSWNYEKKNLQKNENETKIKRWGMRTLPKCN